MQYVDYHWDLSPERILFDEELDIDVLGWKGGDCFKIVNYNGRAMLVKMNPVTQFVQGHKVNCDE